MGTSMPLMIEGKFWPQVYQKTTKALSTLGKDVAPRGKRTLELQPCCTVTEDLSQPCLFIENRWLNYAFGYREAFWILDADRSLSSIGQYNNRIKQFSDDGSHMHGAYGPRIFKTLFHGPEGDHFDQFKICAERLKKDRDTRQAVINIWDAALDSIETKDYPCNTQLMFKVRDGLLNMTVIRRSSDLVWGLPYDHLCFTLVLLAMAGEVGLPPGRLVEFADSLHFYTDLYPEELKVTLQSINKRAVGVDVNILQTFTVEQFRRWLEPLKKVENDLAANVVMAGNQHLKDTFLPPVISQGMSLCYAYLAVKRAQYSGVHSLFGSSGTLTLGAQALLPLLRKRAAAEEQDHAVDSTRVNLQRALSVVL